jgi:plastocyanin
LNVLGWQGPLNEGAFEYAALNNALRMLRSASGKARESIVFPSNIQRSVDMSKMLFSAVFCLGLLPIAPASVYAQGPSTPTERTVRQGDTIEWVAVSGGNHRVRFGESGATSLTEINTILEPTVAQDNPPVAIPSGALFTAKVRDSATVGKTFVFTCGIHTGQMLSETFTVAAKDPTQPARSHKIKGVSGPHWFMEVPAASPPPKDVQVDTAP